MYETRQWNFWFIEASQFEAVRQDAREHISLMSQLHSVMIIKVEDITKEQVTELLWDEDKVRLAMENWLPLKEEQKETVV